MKFMQALLEYEKHKRLSGELQLPASSFPQPTSVEKEVEFDFLDCIALCLITAPNTLKDSTARARFLHGFIIETIC